MNKLVKLLSILLVLFSLQLLAESDERGKEEPSLRLGSQPTTGSSDASSSGGTELTNYSPLSVYDYRMTVKEISFYKRYAHNGRGEVLDVLIDLKSNDSKDNKYSFYVLALNESNAVEPVARSLAPHPSWRPIDPKKEKKIINFSHLVGTKKSNKDELMKAVWDSLKPRGTGLFDKRTYDERKKEVDDRQIEGQRVRLEEPDLEEYILYLSQNPGEAKEFTLYGAAINDDLKRGPEPTKNVESDYKSIPDDENTKDVYKSFPEHTYTIITNKSKTSIQTHHYSEYRPDFYFYNKVVVLIFDPTRAKNKLVHRSIHDVGHIKIKN